MNPKPIINKFIFNSNIDSGFLFSLYEDDYPYIAEVFGNSVSNLDEDIPSLEEAYHKKDLQALKKMAHKLKPVFGFTGMLRQQELIEAFERHCSQADASEHIDEAFRAIMQNILMSKMIIEEEYKRLTVFNQ